MAKNEYSFGLHSIQALLKSSPQRIVNLFVQRGRHDQRVQKILGLAEKAGVNYQLKDKKQLDELCQENHQGVLAELKPGDSMQEKDFYPWLETLQETPFILVLDGVTDPHNLGACMRSADAAGVHAVVIPKDNSVGLTPVARKVASGAADHVPLVVVTNLARTLTKLKQLGLWISGAAGEAEKSHYEVDLRGPRVIVLGAEGSGLRRLTREHCDDLIRIPMQGSVSSLNVSVACGILLFEVRRQQAQ